MIDSTVFVAGLLTVALHSTLLLVLAWVLDTCLTLRLAWRELLWRSALLGAALTTMVAMLPMPVLAPSTETQHADNSVLATIPARTIATSDIRAPSKIALDSAGMTSIESSPRDVVASDLAPINSPAAMKISPLQLPRVLALPLLALWLAGVLMQLTRLLRAEWQLRLLLRRAVPVRDASATDMLDTFAHETGRVAPQLFELAEIDSPFAIGRNIVLPTWARQQWNRSQLRAALAHELAHLQRRDPSWRRLTALWQSLFWFVPLMPLARRRIEACAELACDAAAARAPDGAHALAECLLSCLQQRTHKSDFWSPAAAMARRSSPLMQRVDQLLEGAPMNTLRTGWWGGSVVASLLLGLAFVLPGLQFAHADVQPTAAASTTTSRTTTAQGSGVQYSLSIDDDHTVLRTQDKSGELNAKINGKIAFTSNEDDVESLSSGGSASIEQTRDGVLRRIEFRKVDNGIERRYWLRDHEQPLDADARSWLAQVIPNVLRSSGIGVEARVRRLIERGGVSAVLAEIAKIESDAGRARYIIELSKVSRLRDDELDQTLTLTASINSDYEKRHALQALFTQQKFDDAKLAYLLTLVGDVSSDYERAELMVAVAPTALAGTQSRAAWMKAVSGISSDYEHRRTLEALLSNVKNDDALLQQILAETKNISSDYEQSTLLQNVLAHVDNADAIAPSYLQATRAISSDYEHRQALSALIEARGFGKISALGILDNTSTIHSDYEASQLLKQLIARMPGDADLLKRCHTAAAQLSDYERKSVEQALQAREV